MASVNESRPTVDAARKLYAALTTFDGPLSGMEDEARQAIQAETLFAIEDHLRRIADDLAAIRARKDAS